MDEEYEESGGRWRILILILAALVVAAAAVLTVLLLRGRDAPEEEAPRRMSYAQGATVEKGVTVVDEASLQSAVDDFLSEEEDTGVFVAYKNGAKSTDGQNFNCYLGNDEDNGCDMEIAIYADSGCTDELFRSAPLGPGDTLETVTLGRKLEPGVHDLTVAFIRLGDAPAQSLVTIDFTVS